MARSFDELSHRVIGCAIEVHRLVGPGLLESTYEQCLAYELEQAGIPFQRQVILPVLYKGLCIGNAYIADIIIAGQLIIELKSVEKLSPVHSMQLLTYLRHARIPVGLLINFNVAYLKDGITRIVNNFDEMATP